MSLEGAAVSLGATIVSLVFAALVFNQWISRRKPFQFAWSLGLGLYALASFTQFLAEAYGWTASTYKVYYLVAAFLVAVLGIGSVLLVHRRAGIGFALTRSSCSPGSRWPSPGRPSVPRPWPPRFPSPEPGCRITCGSFRSSSRFPAASH